MPEISVAALGLSLLPLLMAVYFYFHLTGQFKPVIWAGCRMLAQLLLIGQLLVLIFAANHPLWVLLIVGIMFTGACWIAVMPIRQFRVALWPAIGAVFVAAAVHLSWILVMVVPATPWFKPSVVIPLTGMVMTAAMNAVSQCAERYWSERSGDQDHALAAKKGFGAAMIPQINSLMAVGVVSLPGMMTGQILSGVSPLVAVRYQIMIMAMSIGTAALGSYLFLRWSQRSEVSSSQEQNNVISQRLS